MANYHPDEIEKKWLAKWESDPTSKPEDFSAKKKFYALVEFPYPSGAGLHLGHAFTNIIMDIYAHKKRMDGYNVMFPMGWDSFGLPTENYAIKTGIHPAKVTAQNTALFKKQDKQLGVSFDWDREVDTSDPDYYRWTQWIFVQLFKNGLAYKAEMPVGWCPSCKIILANEEIVGGKCERCGAQAEHRMQSQWLLRITAYADRLIEGLADLDYPDYVKMAQINWIGKSSGVNIDYPVVDSNLTISCYSTRPDTNYGATFVVIAPEHPLVGKLTTKENKKPVLAYIDQAKKKSEMERTDLAKEKTGVFTGSYCLNRLTKKQMPIWVSDFVVATAGTGIVVGVPAHDERDWDFARKHDIEIIPVVKPKKGDWDFEKSPFVDIDDAEVFNSDFLDGLPALEAKEKIIEYLVQKGWGKRATNYHLRDWIFSRQHYWGEPIPMVYCESCAKKGINWKKSDEEYWKKMAGWFPVNEDELPIKLPEVEKYQPTSTGESPLSSVKDWVKTTCPVCGGAARRETDTMPNWAGSSWYFLRYTDPKNNDSLADKKKLDYWMPVDVYLGGAEHTTLHLLYSRFWHKFLYDIGVVPTTEPYKARRQHGVILGEDSFKMSKSRGNIINPEDIINKFGADTLRLYLMFMAPYDQTVPWSTKGLEGCWRFLNRVWRLVSDNAKNKQVEENTKIKRVMAKTTKKVTEDIEEMKYNTAIAAIMEGLNEIGRNSLLGKDTIENLILLLAPFAPFFAEELWVEALGNQYSVHQQPWPEYDPSLVVEEKVVIAVQINGKVRGQIELDSAKAGEQEEVEKAAMANEAVAKYLNGQKARKVFFVPGRLINFVV